MRRIRLEALIHQPPQLPDPATCAWLLLQLRNPVAPSSSFESEPHPHFFFCAANGSIVRNSASQFNGADGFLAGPDSIVSGGVSAVNGGAGIKIMSGNVASPGIVRDNVAVLNASGGIYSQGVIVNNISRDNQGAGLVGGYHAGNLSNNNSTFQNLDGVPIDCNAYAGTVSCP